MVLNPGPRRRRRRARRSTRRAHTRTRRTRHNPIMFRPRRRRHVARRHHVRRRRHNPLGIRGGGKILGLPIMQAVTITAGAVAVRALGNLGQRFIPLPDGPLKKYGTQAVATIVGAWAARRFMGHRIGDAVATGGTIAILLGVVNEYVVPKVPLLAEYDTSTPTYLPGVGGYETAPLSGAGSSSEQWQPHF